MQQLMSSQTYFAKLFLRLLFRLAGIKILDVMTIDWDISPRQLILN
jgi:hypothetical protein